MSSSRWSGSQRRSSIYLVAGAPIATGALNQCVTRYRPVGRSRRSEDAGLFPDAAHGDGGGIRRWLCRQEALALLPAMPAQNTFLAIAPSRSGKGVRADYPDAADLKRSAVIYDMKGELRHYTSGWRKASGARTLRFEPTDTHGLATRFNPLAEIRIGEPREVSDTQNLATIICDPDGKGLESGGTEGHFRRIAQAFLVSVILHVLCNVNWRKAAAATLSDLARTIRQPVGDRRELLMEMLHYAHTPAGPHDVVGQAAMEMMNRESREKSGAISTAVFLPVAVPRSCRGEQRAG